MNDPNTNYMYKWGIDIDNYVLYGLYSRDSNKFRDPKGKITRFTEPTYIGSNNLSLINI